MYKNRFFAILGILAVILVSLSGCSAVLESVENEQVREYTEQMLNAIIEKDFDTAYSFVEDAYSKDYFAKEYFEMASLLYDVESYELKLIGFKNHVNVTNGKKLNTLNSTYQMTENDDKYIVYVATNSDCKKLSFFDVNAYESTNLYHTGTINKMSDASTLQWVMLLSNIITIGLTIYAMVDCSKQKIRKKALWLILIILGMVTVALSLSSESLRLNFSLGLFINYSAFIRYGDGSMILRAMIPAGAIVYFIVRSHLIQKASTPPQNTQPPQYPQPQQSQYYQPQQPPQNNNYD